MHGIARDYYGVDLSKITWYVDDEDEIPVSIPDRFDVKRILDSENINEWLATIRFTKPPDVPWWL